MKCSVLTFVLLLIASFSFAQTTSDTLVNENQVLDSLYILEVQDKREPDKVLHAEPLYIDLIRDLGARKGEAEWNVGMGLTDRLNYDSYGILVEYEFAPINRLGVEFEVPVTLYSSNSRSRNGALPSNRIESFKSAFQWSFLVSEHFKTTLALGGIYELELVDLKKLERGNILKGHIYNPFFIAAKRWGNNFHTLLYTGPRIEHLRNQSRMHTAFQINSNFHYMLPGTRNFIGIELNKEISHGTFDMVIRPQMRLGIAENFLIGIVTGIPVNRNNERLSSFVRLIYEPRHRG
ncbi:HAEPLYID family protein [Telluribacter sp. SYSU D00476]|uniref:HAEPLYID family protein n=1 Tax=Telluribacter sp. SYSU D00476 TaxID=2811430 RepID=UPI001FF424EE|nr:HAEPLYID family protein [Telluribacter sp. SYSU D00476]